MRLSPTKPGEQGEGGLRQTQHEAQSYQALRAGSGWIKADTT